MADGRWLDLDRAGGAAGMRLFCFPHAGGGAASYRPWRPALAPAIDVCPVVLPGREARWREPPFRRMSDLVEPLFDALLAAVDRPFAFFGHSMGAAVAYEMARRFSVAAAGPPRCLVVSGRQPPFLPSRVPPVHGLPANQLLARVSRLNGTPAELLADQEVLAAFLPGLRADFELNETYRPAPHPRLAVPVAAFAADHDPLVTPADMLAWQQLTTGGFGARVFPGDHFYLRDGRPDVLSAISEVVLGTLVRQPSHR
jgi:surfactin synthase thioesterase subunit